MELRKQTVCEELSNKLKELGIKHESLFYHYQHFIGRWDDMRNYWGEYITASYCFMDWKEAETVSAFTVAELGEILKDDMMPEYSKIEKVWIRYYKEKGKFLKADNEADARAKMLIYLIENNLLEPSK